MSEPLHILILEDNPHDAELMIREVHHAGLRPQWHRVDNGPDFLAQLDQPPDLILSDYSLPQFNALLALEMLNDRGLDIPFILVSGTVGEEAAVEAMKRGAKDYLLKDRIARLGTAVQHTLEEKRLREERRQMEEQLQLTHEQMRRLLAHSSAVIYTLKLEGEKIIPTFVSENIERLLGVTPNEAARYEWRVENLHPEDRERVVETVARQLASDGYSMEYRIRHKDGTYRWIEDNNRVVQDKAGQPPQAVGVWTDITERKKLEEAVALRERRLASFFTGATAGLAMLDRDLRYVHVNDTLAKINGVTVAEHLGRSVREVLPKLAPTVEPYLQRVIIEGIPILNVEFSGETPGAPGVKRHWIGSYFPTTGPDQSTEAIGAIVVEITERKRAEQELEFRNAILSTQQEASIDGILVVNEDTMIVSYNTRFVEMWELPPELLATQDDRAILESVTSKLAAPETFLQRVQYLYEHRSETSREEVDLKDGRVFDRYSAPMFGPDERYYGRVWYFRDITERKLAEQRLREQAALLDAANDAIYVHDLDDTVLYWNRGAERLYGLTSAEAVGHQIDEVVQSDRTAVKTAHDAVLEQNCWSGELQQTTRAGKPLTVFARWTLLRDEHGQPKKVLAINADISEKKQLEAKFLRAQRLESVGALASGIAHDLNNILAPVLMIAPLLRDAAPDDEARAMLDTIEKCAQRGADIIKQLLTFAHGGAPGARVPLPVGHFLRELDKIIRETFPRDIRPKVDMSKDLWHLLGDATQIHQALMNLCVNARDAMPEGGTLAMAAKNVAVDQAFAAMTPGAKPGPYVCVSVADTGTGIAPENLDRIFDPFFTTKEIGQGTGLGLATVLGIVQGHGGFVQVDSRLGHGTTFELYFPASPQAQPAPGLSREVARCRGQGELILVVDDEVGIRESLRRTLETHGYRVVMATQGAEGLAAFVRYRTEVRAVLTDMMMPVMHGPAMINGLRALDPHLVILGMSGLLERKDVKGFEQLDLSAFLAKPFSGSELLRVLRATLDASGAKAPPEGAE